jgi:hypothetical protein
MRRQTQRAPPAQTPCNSLHGSTASPRPEARPNRRPIDQLKKFRIPPNPQKNPLGKNRATGPLHVKPPLVDGPGNAGGAGRAIRSVLKDDEDRVGKKTSCVLVSLPSFIALVLLPLVSLPVLVSLPSHKDVVTAARSLFTRWSVVKRDVPIQNLRDERHQDCGPMFCGKPDQALDKYQIAHARKPPLREKHGCHRGFDA